MVSVLIKKKGKEKNDEQEKRKRNFETRLIEKYIYGIISDVACVRCVFSLMKKNIKKAQ